MSCKQTVGCNSFYHNHPCQLADLGLQQINTHGEITHGVNAIWPHHTQFLILKKSTVISAVKVAICLDHWLSQND